MPPEGDGQGNTGAGEVPEIGVLLGDHSTNELFAGVENVGSLADKFIENSNALSELQSSQPVVPESVDGYAYEPGENDIPLADEDLAGIKQFAHDNKWTADQFSQAIQMRNDLVNKAVEAHNTKVEEAITAQKAEQGDAYEGNLLMVQKALATFGSEGLKERAEDLAKDPDIYNLVLSFAKVVSPDVLENGVGSGGGSEKTTAQKLYGD